MNKVLFLLLLVGGVALLIYGFNRTDGFVDQFKEFFTGNFSDQTVWMIIGGAVLSIIGLGGLARHGKDRTN